MYPITFFIDTYYGISQVFDIELLKHRGKYFSENLVDPQLQKNFIPWILAKSTLLKTF